MARGQLKHQGPPDKFDPPVTPKQAKMIIDLDHVDEIFWGGAAGGGKSEGLLLYALLRRLQCPGSVGIMFRKTFPDLDRSLIRKSLRGGQYSQFAKYNESKRRWTFFNGSIQEFGHCERDSDVYQYQSAEYDDIEFDELTHFHEFQYTYMKSRLRQATGGKWRTQMRSASNPGNVGHSWVKSYFVDPAFDQEYKEFDADLGEDKSRYFLPARLNDNTLMSPKNRALYRSWLKQLPEDERKMLLEGNWDFVPGAAFAEFSRDIHVCDPVPVPEWAQILCSFDWGFGRPFSVGWWWIDYDGRMWRFAEWYGWSGKANTGIRMAPRDVAKGILQREKAMGLENRNIQRVADPAIEHKNPNLKKGGLGPSVGEMMGEEGVFWSPGDNDRLQGIAQMHERLRRPDEENELPMMMIYSTCHQWLRTTPTLVLDDKTFEDIDKEQEAHAYDESRYACMDRPIAPRHLKPEDSYEARICKDITEPGTSEMRDLEEMYEMSAGEEGAF